MPRVLAYCRVSSAGQEAHGTSLDAQREELGRYARAHGFGEPRWYVEAESGAGTGEHRVEQQRLMRELEAGDLVLVAKQDRWSRDTLHFLASTREIIARGARFLALAERFDPSTPEGRYVSTIMAATAEQERGRIRDRTVGARKRLRALGLHVEGPAPIGYRRVARRLVVDEVTAPIVRKMFALALEGRSCREIGAALRVEHPELRGLDPENIVVRLRDRTYLGEVSLVGARGGAGRRRAAAVWQAGAHEPLVDAATFDGVQAGLVARRRGGRAWQGSPKTGGFLLRGIGRCEGCDHTLGAHVPTRGPGYYVCPYARCTARAWATRRNRRRRRGPHARSPRGAAPRSRARPYGSAIGCRSRTRARRPGAPARARRRGDRLGGDLARRRPRDAGRNRRRGPRPRRYPGSVAGSPQARPRRRRAGARSVGPAHRRRAPRGAAAARRSGLARTHGTSLLSRRVGPARGLAHVLELPAVTCPSRQLRQKSTRKNPLKNADSVDFRDLPLRKRPIRPILLLVDGG